MELFRNLCKQAIQVFPMPRARLLAPKTPGVYVIRDPSNRVVYVGCTARGLRQRLNDHLNDRSPLYYDLNGDCSQLRAKYTFQYLEIDIRRKRAPVEALATGMLCPLHLDSGKAKDA